MRECINESGKAFAVPKTSIYKSRMDMTILRMVQAGLPDKYLDDELEKAAKAKAQSTSKVSSINPLTLEQLGAIMVFQMIALAVCFVTFVLGKHEIRLYEILKNHRFLLTIPEMALGKTSQKIITPTISITNARVIF